MKTGIKTAAIVTALLTGAVISEARPYGQQRGPRPDICPNCGNPNRPRQDRQQFRNQSPQQIPQQQQFQNQRNRPQGAPQFQRPQGQKPPQQAPRQNQNIRRQRATESFGSDGLGQLSAEERQVAKQAIKKYRKARKQAARKNQPAVE